MYEQPVVAGAPVDMGHAHRKVLVGLVADSPVLPFDHDEDDGVAPSVRHDVLMCRLAVGEVAFPTCELTGQIFVSAGWPTVRRQQGKATGVVHQLEVAPHVSAHPGVGRLLGAGEEVGEVLLLLADPSKHCGPTTKGLRGRADTARGGRPRPGRRSWPDQQLDHQAIYRSSNRSSSKCRGVEAAVFELRQRCRIEVDDPQCAKEFSPVASDPRLARIGV